jgi:hypothetical protein
MILQVPSRLCMLAVGLKLEWSAYSVTAVHSIAINPETRMLWAPDIKTICRGKADQK